MTKLLIALSIVIGLICLGHSHSQAQTLLDRKISIEVSNMSLPHVLKLISHKGNFYFSYNSLIIKRDSLVSFTAINKTVKQVLDQLLGNRYQYVQNDDYIILRKAVAPPAVITNPTPSPDNMYTVTGYVLNGETGETISNASIYEKQRLASTLTNEKGFFKIRLRSRYSTASLTISREMFEDTTIVVQPKFNQQLTIVMEPVSTNAPVVTISPVDINQPDTIVIKPPADTVISHALYREEVNQVEKTRWGKFLLSAKQNIQSLNLKKFFAERAFQVSLLPGLSTHGKLSAQVVNGFSVNVIGGYTAGVDGVELGGAFNINKKDMKYVQAAGFLNITGGAVNGVQMAGWHNHVLKEVRGIQSAGISNFVKGSFTGVQMAGIHNHVADSMNGLQGAGISNYINGHLRGWQISGIYNHVADTVNGLQAAGIANYARKITGVQLAGIGNVALQEMRGVQIAKFFNYAKKLRGVQLGLVNIADTSEGYSIGLINIVFKGYHKLTLSTSEVLHFTAAFKTGNRKLYSILLVGGNKVKNDSADIFSAGYGLGREFALGKSFTINPEFTSQYLYLGTWRYANVMNKLHVQFHFKFGKYVSVFAGPSFTTYYSRQPASVPGFKFNIPSASYHTFNLWDDDVKGWFGWNAGISIF